MKPVTNKLSHTLDARGVLMQAVLIEVVPGSILSKASRPSVSRSCPQSARYVGFQSRTWLTGGVDGKGLSTDLVEQRGECPCHGRALRTGVKPERERVDRSIRAARGRRYQIATPRQQDDIEALL